MGRPIVIGIWPQRIVAAVHGLASKHKGARWLFNARLSFAKRDTNKLRNAVTLLSAVFAMRIPHKYGNACCSVSKNF